VQQKPKLERRNGSTCDYHDKKKSEVVNKAHARNKYQHTMSQFEHRGILNN
jgi:hypothetical protein